MTVAWTNARRIGASGCYYLGPFGSPWWAIGGAASVLAVLLAGARLGWLGQLVTCGADQAAVCVAWPGVAAVATWLAFLATIGGLAAVQARHWQHASLARREVLMLAVVLALAFVERAWRIDLAEVGYDESAAASLVAAWRLQGLFPLMGIVSSVGIPNPPGWPYLLTVVLHVSETPYAVVWLGICMSMLAICLTWWVGRRWVGPSGALVAAVFYAGAFWSVFLGRSGWQPVFLQVPVILCLDALLVLAIRRWPWALVLACGWLALMVQLHYIAGVFAAIVPIAAWPARRVLRPRHFAAAMVVAVGLLTPFLLYELNPAVGLHDFDRLAADSGGSARIDLEAWNLFWTLAGNGGVAGLGGPNTAELSQALGRWASLGLLGVPLVAGGLVAAVAGWPRGWRGWLLAGWALMPVLGLTRHTIGVIFHYLYLALPGMALVVGAPAEWTAIRGRVLARGLVGGAIAAYVVVSAGTVWVVLANVDATQEYPALARPLGINVAAAEAARAHLPPGGHVLVGGTVWEVEVLRFSLGYGVPARVFDDCADVPAEANAIYLLNSERTPAAAALAAARAPLLARVPRATDAFLVFGAPSGNVTPARPATAAETIACQNRAG